MAKKISVDRALTDNGVEMEDLINESVVPACCSEGCMVEPDGKCEHGYNSVFLEWGLL